MCTLFERLNKLIMNIRKITVQNHPILNNLCVENLGNVVVFAGINGSGKTTLKNLIISNLVTQNQPRQDTIIEIEPTTAEEKTSFNNQKIVSTGNSAQKQSILNFFRKNLKRRKVTSKVIQFDSSRQFKQVNIPSLSIFDSDIDEENVTDNFYIQNVETRFQDTIRSIFRIASKLRNKIADKAIELKNKNELSMPLSFGNPLDPFKQIFSKLLDGKFLHDINFHTSEPSLHYYCTKPEEKFALATLSAGEKEIITIFFDLLIQQPKNCIILIDEPELHLHPDFCFRLYEYLRYIGDNNQFFLFTHSPDIIMASLSNQVYYLIPEKGPSNRAVSIFETDENHQALSIIGNNIGLIAKGKKIVLLEGEQTSIDRLLYTKIAKFLNVPLTFLPIGGVDGIEKFSIIIDQILEKAIFGINFFMIRDRDKIPQNMINEYVSKSNHRLNVLKYYHIENYFLNPILLQNSLSSLASTDDWRRDSGKIAEKIIELAQEVLPYAVNLAVHNTIRFGVGNIDLMAKKSHGNPKEEISLKLHEKLKNESARINNQLSEKTVLDLFEKIYQDYSELIQKKDLNSILIHFPGRIIFKKFCGFADIKHQDMINLILNCENNIEDHFDDLKTIMKEINEYSIIPKAS